MNVEELEREVEGLNDAERRRLMAHLVAIEDRKRPAYRAEMARKIDDKDPSHWLTLEEFDRLLAERDSERPE